MKCGTSGAKRAVVECVPPDPVEIAGYDAAARIEAQFVRAFVRYYRDKSRMR
jgi:hypothetical protein